MKDPATNFWFSFSTRLYQSLIFSLPKSFRQKYAAEMEQVFRDCCRDAYKKKGIVGLCGELLISISDLLVNSVKERIMTLINDERGFLLLLLTATFAIGGGLVAAFADLRNNDVQGPVLLIFIFSFILGAIRPKSFWLSGLLVGLMMPLIHLAAQVYDWKVNYSTDSSTAYWSFLALIPALTGSSFGALFRLILNYIWSQFRQG
ncbi:MAG: hypothetical protein ACRD6X_07495 [Pyrinomonadaceae bacterium]